MNDINEAYEYIIKVAEFLVVNKVCESIEPIAEGTWTVSRTADLHPSLWKRIEFIDDTIADKLCSLMYNEYGIEFYIGIGSYV